MSTTVVVFDLETAPDLAAVARVHGLDRGDADAARDKLGTGFPKLIYHSIVCIGALIATREDGAYRVRALGAPHVGERSEGRLIADFAAKLDQLRPQLVSFNGHGFDLPTLRYRAMINGVAAPGLTCRPYYRRYDESALDLCDLLGNFDARAKVGLDVLCRALNLPGKPESIDGGRVADFVAAGRLAEVAAYCVSDVCSTYRLFLAYEKLRGALDPDGHTRSSADLERFVAASAAEHIDTAIAPRSRSEGAPTCCPA
ncbi:3'-5' exonuclease [Methylobacterium sp. J-001]|uniref:3'-5' exonuclease n=1 Tax=Methylobacterium sp. J-001 TaxID=2836609 RepID=UPI001FBB2CD6|nr:3'-5' exonuclease [Methylobacterium sp. J-001]MCJ2118399.1 3'-5' exonuclease [Methylobacterium sp. J-001]